MTNEQGTELAKRFFEGNSASYDSIARLSTLGLDALWKQNILALIPQGSSRIVEQACGTGILTFKIAKRFPDSHIIGIDLHQGYLDQARRKASNLTRTNIEFIHGRAEDVVVNEPVDCICSSYLAKYVDLDLLVRHARDMLRPGGSLIMHELTRPGPALLHWLWKLHFKFLQSYGSWKYPEWKVAFNELPELLEHTTWLEELTAALHAHGFTNVRRHHLFLGTSAIITGQREVRR